MPDSLGLSIGMTNLVAARVGRPPVIRRSVLTLFGDRTPEVGVPGQNPNLGQPGLVLSGFVDRVGDPVPLVAADGSAHRGELILVEALDAMARTVGGGAPIAIAVPAHWGPGAVGALRGALRDKPSLAPNGVPAALIPDSTAALAALQAAPGLPDRGVVVLCDFGGSGTSVTLADAGADFATIGQTIRYPEFSGDQVDQALLNHVVAGVADAGGTDTAGTTAVESLARLRDECRQAKERLSAATATVLPVELPGFSSDIRLTRAELERLVEQPLAGLLDTVAETLQHNNIPAASVSAVATVGGGAGMPLVTARLSERFRAPVVTTPQSQLNVAAGAALVAERGVDADAPTGLASAADAPTSMASAAWAAGAAGLAAGESATDGAPSATFRALAWSQDESPAAEPVPYRGEDYGPVLDEGRTEARPPVAFARDDEYDAEPEPLPWYKRPPILFAAAAAAALAAVGGLAVTLTGTSGDSTPVTETSTSYWMGPGPAPTTSITTVTTGSDGIATTTVLPPPPPPPSSTTSSSDTTSPSDTTTTTTSPTTTTTTSTTTTTRTTSTTTTTRTTTPTTTQPTTQTTTQPVTTTEEPPPTTTVDDAG